MFYRKNSLRNPSVTGDSFGFWASPSPRVTGWKIAMVWCIWGSLTIGMGIMGAGSDAVNPMGVSVGHAAESNAAYRLGDTDQWEFASPVGTNGWYGMDGTPAFQAVTVPTAEPEGDHTLAIQNVGLLPLPFASNPDLERCAMDYDLRKAPRYEGNSVDCTTVDQFELTLETDRPAAIGSVTLYLRSGGGWYSMAQNLTGDGRQTLVFSVSEEHSEGTPVGLNSVDGFRIAFWRGASVDASVKLIRLRANRNPILIIESAAEGPESLAAKSCAKQMLEQLRSQNLPVGMISESQVAKDGDRIVSGRQVIVLPYNPEISDAMVTILRNVIQGDHPIRLIAFYQLPEAVRQAAGLGDVEFRYVRPTTETDALTYVRFDMNDVQKYGYPVEFRQSSHNITALIAPQPTADSPTTANTGKAENGREIGKSQSYRLLGEWYNASGAATGYAAAVASDRAIFFSHILMNQDPEQQRRMVTAMLGELWPEIWLRAASDAVRSAPQVGTYRDVQWLRELPPEKRGLTSGEQKAFESLDAALTEYDRLNTAMETFTPDFGDSVGMGSIGLWEKCQSRQLELRNIVSRAEALKRLFMDVYIRSFDSLPKYKRDAKLAANPGEVRAWWEHAGTGIYPGDWDRTMKELAEASFTHVIPNMLWAGSAHYASDYLPSDAVYEKYGDQIAQAVTAGKKYGVEVHVWKVCYNLATAPQAFVDQMTAADRTQVKADGTPEKWLCPSHPENIALEINTMCEIVEKYEVDGIHFDYIRYPGEDVCFCDGCRQRFEAQTGVKVEHWPQDCVSGPLKEAYTNWRCDQITKVVAAVHERAKKIRPEVQISAAVFPLYPSCRRGVLQDWPKWVTAGYLDFLCPMSYNANPVAFEGWIEREIEQVGGKIPVYPGIGATATGIAMTPDIVAAEIDATRRCGAKGFTIFNLNETTAKRFLKPLRPMLVPTIVP